MTLKQKSLPVTWRRRNRYAKEFKREPNGHRDFVEYYCQIGHFKLSIQLRHFDKTSYMIYLSIHVPDLFSGKHYITTSYDSLEKAKQLAEQTAIQLAKALSEDFAQILK